MRFAGELHLLLPMQRYILGAATQRWLDALVYDRNVRHLTNETRLAALSKYLDKCVGQRQRKLKQGQ